MAANASDDELLTGINVTPLVDVVLVLLVVLMVTAGWVSRRAIAVELPTARGDAAAGTALEVVVEASGRVTVDGTPQDDTGLAARARALSAAPDAHATVSADRGAHHGDVVHVIDVIRDAGLVRFALRVRP